jgi:hypothetical protein
MFQAHWTSAENKCSAGVSRPRALSCLCRVLSTDLLLKLTSSHWPDDAQTFYCIKSESLACSLQATPITSEGPKDLKHLYRQAFISHNAIRTDTMFMLTHSTWSWHLQRCTLPTGWPPRGGETLTQHMPPCYQHCC